MAKRLDYEDGLLKSIAAELKGIEDSLVEDGYSAGNVVMDWVKDCKNMVGKIQEHRREQNGKGN